MKKTISRGNGKQMLSAFERKLAEFQDSDVYSSTEVEASTKYVDIPYYAKDTFYKDVGGGFGGDNGEVYSLEEIMEMWNSEHDNDPCMQEYGSFDDWFYDTETNYLQECWPDDLEECTDITASVDYDYSQIVKRNGNKYEVKYNVVNTSQTADPVDMLHSFRGQVTPMHQNDDKEYIWASFDNGAVTYYQGADPVDSSYYSSSDDMDVENDDWCDVVVDSVIENLDNLNHDADSEIINNCEDVYDTDVIESSSEASMKTWLVSGYNYKGKAIVNQEIEARTKNAAIHKFEEMYGNIATRAEEA